ncbi:retrovirus-related pol polyprotein from transposon TNT 1-94 [Tanacetum coccineum]
MYRIASTTTQTKTPQLPHASRNTNPHMSKSSGVIHSTSVSRPQLKSYQVKEKVVPNISQVKFTKKEVEDHHRISSISKKTKSVTACNDSSNSRTSNANAVCAECGKCVFNSNHDACVSRYLKDVNARTKKPHVVPISASKPKRKANKSVATPHKKTVASDTTIQKSKSYYKKLYENTNQEWKWWIAKRCPSVYTWTQKPLRTKKIWMPKIRKDDESTSISPTIDIVSRITNIVQLILFIVDSGCTKHMTGNLKLLCNSVEKFLGTVRFGNGQCLVLHQMTSDHNRSELGIQAYLEERSCEWHTTNIVEPKNIKEAMADSAWIEAMQDELHQMIEDQTIICNKSTTVAKVMHKGYVDPDNPEKSQPTKKALYGLRKAPKPDILLGANYAKYALEILKKHNMDNCHSIGTPLATKPKLDVDLSGEPVDQSDYHSKIRSLVYLTSSRPDLVPAFLVMNTCNWMSKKQNCTAMSSAEAEYVAFILSSSNSTAAQLVDTNTESDPEEALSEVEELQSVGFRVPLMGEEFEAFEPIARIAEATALSPAFFRKRYRSSYETSSSSSLTLPVRKRYKGTSELILDTDSEGDELRKEDTEEDGEDESNESQGLEGEELGLEKGEAAPEGQQQAVLVVNTAVSEPLGLGYRAARRRALKSIEEITPSMYEVGQSSRSVPEQEGVERIYAFRQLTLVTWVDPKDNRVYIDVPAYAPPAAPVQTPPSPEWSSSSLPISPSSLIVSSPIDSPVATPTAIILVDKDQFIEVGAQLELHESILRDHTQRLDALPPTLVVDIDKDVRELYTRSGLVRDEIFSQRYRFRSLEREQERTDVTFGALWRPVLTLEAGRALQQATMQRELQEMRGRAAALQQERGHRGS